MAIALPVRKREEIFKTNLMWRKGTAAAENKDEHLLRKFWNEIAETDDFDINPETGETCYVDALRILDKKRLKKITEKLVKKKEKEKKSK